MKPEFNFGFAARPELQYSLDYDSKLPPSAQEGRARADENANSKWRHIFDACVLAAAKKKSEITSDDVLTEIETLPNPPETHNLSAIGAAMHRAYKMGILQGTDRTKRSERREKHGNRQNVWISLYYRSAQ
jgi:hypothetical protein